MTMMVGLPARVHSLVMPPGAFRLLLAAAVMVSHLSRINIGRLAVVLFFYLSGYWVTKVWEEKFSGREVLRFYAARYLRIAPLYFVALIGTAIVLREKIPPASWFLVGLSSSGNHPLGVAWSLDVELQFYVLLPLLAPLLNVRNLWSAALCAALISGGWWAFYATDPLTPAPGGIMTALQYLPAFAFGALTYKTAWVPSERTANLSLLAFAAMTVATAFTPFLLKGAKPPFHLDIWALLWMTPLLPYVARSLAARSSPLDRHFGNLSYPLYLVHETVITFMVGRFGPALPVKTSAVVVAICLSLAVYWFMDRPVDRWRVALTERTGAMRLRPSN